MAIEQAVEAIKGMFLQREGGDPVPAPEPANDDAELLEMFKKCKKESFSDRWIWERGWMRNIHYVNNRHWIEYVRRSNEWRDVRLAKWFPKPVTNKIGEGVMALRAMFTSVNIGVNVRPVGADPKNVAVASMADELIPLLHEEHDMDAVLNEADFWFIVTGNVFLHTYLEMDVKHGVTKIHVNQCQQCGEMATDEEVMAARGVCPKCQGQVAPAVNPETGEPLVQERKQGKGVTVALSPFELAFPNYFARFEDVPYVIRLRWRNKSYYENHPVLGPQVEKVKWSKAPTETALQLFRSLPYHNDMGVAPFMGSGAAENEEEGAAEYELWMRPCDKYPEGLVIRVLGDGDPIILHNEEEEAIPGPLPYVDADGKPLFTFTHAPFEQRGGRVYGTSPLDGAIPKQNLLNQLDAFILMIINRMGNPLWLVPKGAEIEKFTGEPGLVVKWNPLTVGGNAKPERVDGTGPNASLFQIRDSYLRDIEEALGTFDVIKGTKPAGVEAFSAMQLLVERSQSRFSSAFKARGTLYKDWAKFSLEIERDFGPSERTQAVMSPARTWTQKVFENANLQGCFTCIVEDGSMTPKTALGTRASIEHLNQMGLIDPNDADQKYVIYSQFGQSKLAPALDIHVQAALRKQQAFEDWAQDDQAIQLAMQTAQTQLLGYQAQLESTEQPEAPPPGPDGQPAAEDPAAALPQPPSITATTPLAWKPWYSAPIHKQEFMKWMNSDRMMQLLAENPALEQFCTAHLMEIDAALAQEMMMAAMAQAGGSAQVSVGRSGGSGEAMRNSNGESGGAQNAGDSGGKRQGAK